MSTAGDVNGDGVDDLLIGARLADPNGEGSGASYVVFGQAAPLVSVTWFGQRGDDAMDGGPGSNDNCNGGRGTDTARSCEQTRGVP